MTDTKEAAAANGKPKEDVKSFDETIEPNEIRVTAQGKMRNYVAYAASVFSEEKSHTVVLKGMGRVINKTVSLAEILKRRVKGLYQNAEIGSIRVVDEKPDKAEGESNEVVRLLSVIKIVLTTEPDDKAKFQPPIDESMVEPMDAKLPKRGRGIRNRKRGKKQAVKAAEEEEKEAVAEEKPAKAKKAKNPNRRRPRRNKKEAPKDSEEPASAEVTTEAETETQKEKTVEANA